MGSGSPNSGRAAPPRARVARWLLALLGMSALLALIVSLQPASRSQTAGPEARRTAEPGARSSAAFHFRPIEAPLPSDSAFAGSVRNASGKPVAGARVCAFCASCDPVALQAALCVATDAKGTWSLSAPLGSPHRIAASAAGYAAVQAEGGRALIPATPEPTRVDIVLSAIGVAVAGQVLDAAGGVVANARVRAISWSVPATVLDQESDEQGHFELWMPAGAVTLTAQAAGYAPGQVFATAPSSDVEIALTPGASIRGRVVAASDGRALGGARVRAVPAGLPTLAAQRTTLSAPDGSFALDGLEPNRYELLAEGEGARSQDGVLVPVGLGEVADGIELRLVQAATVDGRVLVEGSGEPCMQGTVALLNPPDQPNPSRPPPLLAANIGADGGAHFPSVPAGRYGVQVECLNFIPVDAFELVVAAEPASAVWKVRPGVGLSIDVVDERRQPVPRAQVAVVIPVDDPNESPLLMPYTTDLRGHCDVPTMLSPGPYKVVPYGGAKGETVEVELKEGAGVVPVRLELTGSGSVLVQTVNADGSPASAGLLVNAYAEGTELHLSAAIAGSQVALGEYRIGALAAGDYRIEVSDGVNPPFGLHSGQTRVRVGSSAQSRLRVVVDRSQTIRGRVVDAEGQPVANAWVRAEFEAGPGEYKNPIAYRMLGPRKSLTDADGAFEIEKLSGTARFRVAVRTFEGQFAEALGVRAGTSALTLTLAPGAGVQEGAAVAVDVTH